MKKIKLLTIIAFILIATTPNSLSATPTVNPIEDVSNKSAKDDYAVLYHRLNEINDMKKTDLSRADKRILRKEVKSIENKMQKISSGGGIYISAGAIIVILILLIILL
jgi:hypothetical protein